MIQSITFGKELTVNDICPECGADMTVSSDESVYVCPECGYEAPSGYVFTDPRNTYDDWHIIANERPVFQPPEAKTNYIEIPGGNGVLDLSESLTGYPIYENREGTFTFKVLNDYGDWADRYSEIMNFLHGQSMKAILADDPFWFYCGRFTIDEWKAGDTWSEITIGYNVNPFKWSICSSISDWLWDPFNFETGMIPQNAFSEIEIDSVDAYTELTFDAELFGKVPIAPNVILVEDLTDSNTGMDIRFVNNYLNIDITQTFYESDGTTFAPDFIFYGETGSYSLYFRGKGTVSIEFRVGRL